MPAHRDEAQSRWQMWEPEYSCEAGVPSVLADEILVCSKQPQGHSLSSSSLFLCLRLVLLRPTFLHICCLGGSGQRPREDQNDYLQMAVFQQILTLMKMAVFNIYKVKRQHEMNNKHCLKYTGSS